MEELHKTFIYNIHQTVYINVTYILYITLKSNTEKTQTRESLLKQDSQEKEHRVLQHEDMLRTRHE